jgi:predicted nucleic acid-binding protein
VIPWYSLAQMLSLISCEERSTLYTLLKHRNGKEPKESNENLTIYQSSELALGEAANAYIHWKSIGKVMSNNDLMIYGVCIANYTMLLTQDKAF